MDKYIFQAKTPDGFTVKNLIELLQNVVKDGCFYIDHKGVYSCAVNSNRSTISNVKLNSDDFESFVFNGTDHTSSSREPKATFELGLNLNHLMKMLKTIKKRDAIELFIKEKAPSDFGITITTKESSKVTTSYIKILRLQQIIYNDEPLVFKKIVNLPSGDYQKMIKSMMQIGGKVVNVKFSEGRLKFSCNVNDVMIKETSFEAEDPPNVVVKKFDKNPCTYDENFDMERLTRIIKISGIGKVIQIGIKDGEALSLESDVGSIGKVNILLKTNNQIERDNYVENSFGSEEE